MDWFKTKPQQAPKLTRGQQELQDFRAQKAGEVQRQVQADAKAGGKAMRQQAKPKPKPPGVKGPVKPSVPKGGAIPGAGTALMVDGLLESSGAYNFITEGAVDGAAMLMGASPAQRQQALNIQRGVPTVRSQNGVSYNINDPKQNTAYQKALAGAGGGGSTRQMADIRGSETLGSDKQQIQTVAKAKQWMMPKTSVPVLVIKAALSVLLIIQHEIKSHQTPTLIPRCLRLEQSLAVAVLLYLTWIGL